MTKEQNKEPIVKFILNKGEIGNIHTALKTLVVEGLTGSAKDDVILMGLMEKIAPIYDTANNGEVISVEMSPDDAYTCWRALSFVGENGLLPKSQNAKVITLIQHMSYALELLNNIEIDPKEVAQMENVLPMERK